MQACRGCQGRWWDRPKSPRLDLGNLTGIWADIYARREKLLRKHARAVSAAWDACVAELGSPRQMVRQFRSEAALVAKAADPDRARWKDAGTAAALAWLDGVYRGDGYPALVAAIEQAITEGMAEGEADALALAADRQHVDGFAIGAAFAAAADRLQGDPGISQQAQDTAEGIASSAAAAAGLALADQAGEDGSEADMAAAVDGAVNGDGSSLASRLGDAIWSAIGDGALSLWSRISGGGTTEDGTPVTVQVDWLTEPGACSLCEENRANGPYAPEDVPPYGAHPHCRCWLASMQGLPASLLASFLS